MREILRHSAKMNMKGKELKLECRHFEDGSLQLKVGDAVFNFKNAQEWLREKGLLPEFYMFLHFQK